MRKLKSISESEGKIMGITDKAEFEKENKFGTGAPNSGFAQYFSDEEYAKL